MKKISLYILLIITMVSCDEFLDVKPTGKLIPTTVEDFEKLLNDPKFSSETYTNMVYMDPDMYMPGGNYDALWQQQWKKQYTWNETPYIMQENDWDWKYKFDNMLVYNTILADIDGAPLGKATEDTRKLAKGEAHASRALDLFLLVNEYGPHYSDANKSKAAIPMPLKVDLQAQLSRSTVGEVYNQILSDLNTAENLLDQVGLATNPKANFRSSKAGVKGLLALVHLYMGNWDEAVTYSDEALAIYSFLYNYNTLGNYTNGNVWSGFNITDFDYSTDCKEVLWNRYGRWTFNDPAGLFHPDVAALFDKTNDRRWTLHATQTTYTGQNVAPNYCYARRYAENNVGITIPNLVLVNAEAKLRAGDAAGATTALNTLRAKRYTPAAATYVYSSDAALLTEIKNERRREFFATGLNLIDLKRYHELGETIPTYTRTVAGVDYTLEPGSSKYVVPISAKVKRFNPNL